MIKAAYNRLETLESDIKHCSEYLKRIKTARIKAMVEIKQLTKGLSDEKIRRIREDSEP